MRLTAAAVYFVRQVHGEASWVEVDWIEGESDHSVSHNYIRKSYIYLYTRGWSVIVLLSAQSVRVPRNTPARFHLDEVRTRREPTVAPSSMRRVAEHLLTGSFPPLVAVVLHILHIHLTHLLLPFICSSDGWLVFEIFIQRCSFRARICIYLFLLTQVRVRSYWRGMFMEAHMAGRTST